MKLPKQAKPVMRTAQKKFNFTNVRPSGIITEACKAACNSLPEPLRTACKVAC
jgi:hypothetical protein